MRRRKSWGHPFRMWLKRRLAGWLRACGYLSGPLCVFFDKRKRQFLNHEQRVLCVSLGTWSAQTNGSILYFRAPSEDPALYGVMEQTLFFACFQHLLLSMYKFDLLNCLFDCEVIETCAIPRQSKPLITKERQVIANEFPSWYITFKRQCDASTGGFHQPLAPPF